MSTPAVIGLRKPDNTIEAIYVHWDGYPSHTGNILLEYYNTYEKAKQLISLGNLSSIDKLISPPEGVPHNFDNPAPDVCVAYCRDRNAKFESFQIPKQPTVATIQNMAQYDAVWLYLFENNQWHKATPASRRWYPLKKTKGD